MKFSKEMYPKIALIKSAYTFTDRAYVHLDADDGYYYVDLREKPGYTSIDENEFVNEMMCQCARHEIYQQTKALREMLVARAIASTVIQDYSQVELDELAASQLESASANAGGTQAKESSTQADGVEKQQFKASEILQDWFASDENA